MQSKPLLPSGANDRRFEPRLLNSLKIAVPAAPQTHAYTHEPVSHPDAPVKIIADASRAGPAKTCYLHAARTGNQLADA